MGVEEETLQRGEIWLVHLDPTKGSEIKKTRPALVISNNINNQYAATVTVLPITEKGKKVYPFEVFLPVEPGVLKKPSKIKCQQIRTVDKGRLVKLLGKVKAGILKETENALLIHLGISI